MAANTALDKKGMKRICNSCSTRFYDFNKRPVVCPNCKTEFTGEIKVKARRSRVAAANDIAEEGQVTDKTAVTDEEDEDVLLDEEEEVVSLDDMEEEDDDIDEEDEEADPDLELDDEDLDEDFDEDDDDFDDEDDIDEDDDDADDDDAAKPRKKR